ncbi:MAG: hypothetical protein GW949_00820 [Spirochaetales bacterium]|nr:hypothetical protein [Spirochaetales bacterium]
MNVPQIIGAAWNEIKELRLDQGKQLLESAIPYAFENPVVLGALKSISFWKERSEIFIEHSEPLVQADYFFSQWLTYLEFAKRINLDDEESLYTFKQYAFFSVKIILEKKLRQSENADPQYTMKLGICEKALGNYIEAKSNLEKSGGVGQDNPELLGHLADVYALLNEPARAKVLFREAFFIDPQRVPVELLESELILRLSDYTKEKYSPEKLAREWLPVYGVIFGVFSVKRELRAVEYGRLRQGIYSLEREYAHEKEKRELIEPRLINKYFWQIDHLISISEEPQKINEVLLKIKSLNPDIHGLYTK